MDRIPKQVIERLQTVPLFSSCSKKELRSIALLGVTTTFPDGTVFAEQGRPGFEFFLLLQGNARCLVNRKLVATFGAGDYFGEMALLDNGPRYATVIADGPARVLVLDAREFSSLLHTAPTIAEKLLKAFALRVRANATIHD
jgi:CRP/FNR family transcriptional regulator, cyclic AMP receptor protein